MKTSSAGPFSHGQARTFFILNQFATPGLGSFLGGHRVTGLGQMALAVAGFAMVCGWFVLTLICLYRLLVQQVQTPLPTRLGFAGLLTFGVAWVWALTTSLRILREAKKDATPPHIPPPLKPP